MPNTDNQRYNMGKDEFRFRHFAIRQDRCAMKVGTDGVLLGSWACRRKTDACMRVLDIGTGTGLISLFIAQRFPNAIVTAIDIDAEAAGQASDNFRLSPFNNRLSSQAMALQDMGETELYDLIVCNPPFFTDSLKSPNTNRTIARHTTTLTFADIARKTSRLLYDDGILAVIVPADSKGKMESEAIFNGLSLQRQCYVKTKEGKPPKRVMMEFGRKAGGLKEEIIVVGGEDYQAITGKFYL